MPKRIKHCCFLIFKQKTKQNSRNKKNYKQVKILFSTSNIPQNLSSDRSKVSKQITEISHFLNTKKIGSRFTVRGLIRYIKDFLTRVQIARGTS